MATLRVEEIVRARTLSIVAEREAFEDLLWSLPQCDACADEPSTYVESDTYRRESDALEFCDACAARKPTDELVELPRAPVVRALATKAKGL
jgi:hypothetical protein